MTRITWRAAVLVACVAAPGAATAQTPPPTPKTPQGSQGGQEFPGTQTQPQIGRNGRYGQVTFRSSEIYDSNLFSSQGPQAEGDLFSRAAPSVEGGYRSTRVKFGARYGFEAERYFNHPELNNLLARQEAGTELTWQATRRLRFGAGANDIKTQTPAELNIESFISPGRAPAERASADGTVAYNLTTLTAVSGGIDYSRDQFGSGVARTSQARLSIDRRVGRRNDYRVSYGANLVEFSGFLVNSRELSHVVTGGWTRRFYQATTLTVDAGPRFGHGEIHPEWTVQVAHRSAPLELSVAVARTLATAIGEIGTLDVRQATVSGAYHPVRRVTIGGATALARSIGQTGTEATVRSFEADVTYLAERRVSLMTSARFGHQTGTVAGLRASVPFRTLSFSVAVSVPPAPAIPRRVRP